MSADDCDPRDRAAHDRDAHDRDTLARFVAAQDEGGTYARAVAELETGRKRSHWMWFVLPQLRGLGRSAMAERYGLDGRGEAEAYVRHPVLGPRLVAACRALLAHPREPIDAILGDIDAMKCRSCATLFAAVAPGEPVFRAVLDTFFAGEDDPATLARL